MIVSGGQQRDSAVHVYVCMYIYMYQDSRRESFKMGNWLGLGQVCDISDCLQTQDYKRNPHYHQIIRKYTLYSAIYIHLFIYHKYK